jgi:geranylgeranyl pyrophosphate synthase
LGRPLSDDEREHARKLVVATDGVERTIDVARSYLDLARTALEVVPSTPLREGFTALTESLLENLEA